MPLDAQAGNAAPLLLSRRAAVAGVVVGTLVEADGVLRTCGSLLEVALAGCAAYVAVAHRFHVLTLSMGMAGY